MPDAVKLTVTDKLPFLEGLGITTSMATGKLVADLILHRTPAIPAEPYLPGRKVEAHA